MFSVWTCKRELVRVRVGVTRGMSEFDDVVHLNSDTGDLLVEPDGSDIWNVSVNVSLACFTEAAHGDRAWSELEDCFRVVFSIFSLERVVVQGWPLSILFPWERADPAASPASAALHTETDHVHHTHDGLDTTGASLLFFFIFFGFFVLLMSLCVTDGFYTVVAPTDASRKEKEYVVVRRVVDP